MALRLAGEEFSVIQGLDGQGWLRQITRNDSLPGLSLRQQGSAPGLRSRVPAGQRFLEMVWESDGVVIGYFRESARLELASAVGSDVRLAPGAGGRVKVLAYTLPPSPYGLAMGPTTLSWLASRCAAMRMWPVLTSSTPP